MVLGRSQVLTVEALPTLQRWALRNGVLLLRDAGNGRHIRESSLECSEDFSPFVYIPTSFVLGQKIPVRTNYLSHMNNFGLNSKPKNSA